MIGCQQTARLVFAFSIIVSMHLRDKKAAPQRSICMALHVRKPAGPNDHGEIVGFYEANGLVHGFLFRMTRTGSARLVKLEIETVR